MPHVIIKLWPGRTIEQKRDLSDRITESLIKSLDVPDESISISIEEVPREKWKKSVYDVDIAGKEDLLYKKPGKIPT